MIGNPLESAITAERLMCSGLLDEHPGVGVISVPGGGFLPDPVAAPRRALGESAVDRVAAANPRRLLGLSR